MKVPLSQSCRQMYISCFIPRTSRVDLALCFTSLVSSRLQESNDPTRVLSGGGLLPLGGMEATGTVCDSVLCHQQALLRSLQRKPFVAPKKALVWCLGYTTLSFYSQLISSVEKLFATVTKYGHTPNQLDACAVPVTGHTKPHTQCFTFRITSKRFQTKHVLAV